MSVRTAEFLFGRNMFTMKPLDEKVVNAATKQALLTEDNSLKTDTNDNKEKKKKKGSAWAGLRWKCKLLWPFLWPRGRPALQLRLFFILIILVISRVLGLLVPIYYKKIVNSLTPKIPNVEKGEDGSLANGNIIQAVTTATSSRNQSVTMATISSAAAAIDFRYDYIIIFIVLRSLRGRTGYLNVIRSMLWIDISQNCRKKLRLTLFSHLHSLSMRWHLQRKTGEVLRVMDRGVVNVNQVLSHALTQIVPVVADIIVAVIYFVTSFNVWIGLIVLSSMLGYLISTICITEFRTKYRRRMNEADNQRNATSVDSILNFETVKYHAAEEWESNNYEKDIDLQQVEEWHVTAAVNFLHFCQNTSMSLGLLGGSVLCAWYVVNNTFTVGDFVLYGAYMIQLFDPLDMFGAYYRVFQQAFVDMENMFDMLAEEKEITDAADALPLAVMGGQVEFQDVSFHYDPKKPVLENINFTVQPGQTFALVGRSGAGKSTIVRLLFRLFDVTSGCIKIDGRDLRKVTQKSLREQVGVVPQDTVLFNKDIRYNIRYGRMTASDAEVEQAAMAADIHESIISFPDGYSSKIGERGLKLSGGEKQRIAIARTVLKAPEICALDEATSALDTKTERTIQDSLHQLCANRTTLIVAHRLSTIIHAHQILVIQDGHIIERGTHEELLIKQGVYADMWQEQNQKGSAPNTMAPGPQSAAELKADPEQHIPPVVREVDSKLTNCPKSVEFSPWVRHHDANVEPTQCEDTTLWSKNADIMQCSHSHSPVKDCRNTVSKSKRPCDTDSKGIEQSMSLCGAYTGASERVNPKPQVIQSPSSNQSPRPPKKGSILLNAQSSEREEPQSTQKTEPQSTQKAESNAADSASSSESVGIWIDFEQSDNKL